MVHDSMYRVCIKALIMDGDRVLLARESSGVWDILGGGIEDGESPQECLEREIMEEAGVVVDHISSNPQMFFTSVSNSGNPVANVVYVVDMKTGNMRASGECQELRFFTLNKVEELNMSPSAKKLFQLLQDA